MPLLTQLLEAVPRAVVLDVNERLVWANNEFFKFTGLHPAQVLEQPLPASSAAWPTAPTSRCGPLDTAGRPWPGEGWIELSGAGRRYMREHLIPVDCQVACRRPSSSSAST